MDDKKQLVVAIIITAVLFGGGGYFLGKHGMTTQTPQVFSRGSMGDRTGQDKGTRMIRFGGGGIVSGEVLSKDATSLTLKLRDGGSRIVFYAPSTGVMRMASGTIDDIAIGTQVSVIGAQNPDGSMVATSLQLRPEWTSKMVP